MPTLARLRLPAVLPITAIRPGRSSRIIDHSPPASWRTPRRSWGCAVDETAIGARPSCSSAFLTNTRRAQPGARTRSSAGRAPWISSLDARTEQTGARRLRSSPCCAPVLLGLVSAAQPTRSCSHRAPLATSSAVHGNRAARAARWARRPCGRCSARAGDRQSVTRRGRGGRALLRPGRTGWIATGFGPARSRDRHRQLSVNRPSNRPVADDA